MNEQVRETFDRRAVECGVATARGLSAMADELERLRAESGRMRRVCDAVARALGDDGARRYTVDEIAEALAKRLMPEGMEWPRFEDGRYVEIGDLWVDVDGNVREVCDLEVNADGKFDIYDEDDENETFLVGARVKRPAPPATASRECRDSVAPLDADGVPIRVGDTVWHEDGSKLRVTGIDWSRDEQDGERIIGVESLDGEAWAEVRNLSVTHREPDSWGLWRQDLLADCGRYCRDRGIRYRSPWGAEVAWAKDMELRARILAGVK